MGYMNYGDEKKKEHLAIVKSAIVRYPNITGSQIIELLEKKNPPLKLGWNYVFSLMKKIHRERAQRYNRTTKLRVIAEFDDFIHDLEPLLRNISNNSKNDMAKIFALKQLVENKKSLIDKMMDLGVLDRQLGVVDVNVFDVAKLSQIAREEIKKAHNEQQPATITIIENKPTDNSAVNG